MKLHVRIIFLGKRIEAEALSKKKKNTKQNEADQTQRREMKSCKTWLFTLMTARSVRMVVNMTITTLLICMVNISSYLYLNCLPSTDLSVFAVISC